MPTPHRMHLVSGDLGGDGDRVLPLVAEIGLEERDVGKHLLVELATLGGVDLDARGLSVEAAGDGGRDGGAPLDLELVAGLEGALSPSAVVCTVDLAEELGVFGGVVDANLGTIPIGQRWGRAGAIIRVRESLPPCRQSGDGPRRWQQSE